MRSIGTYAGAALVALATFSAVPAMAQTGVEVVLQTAGSLAAGRDQPYGVPVNTVALSPDGKRAITGDLHGDVRLYNVADGSLLRTFAMRGSASVVAFLADSRRVVAAGRDIRVWDGESGRLIHEIDASLPYASPLAVSPDGTRIVATGADSAVTEWTAATAVSSRTYSAEKIDGSMTAAVYSPDGRRLATAHSDGMVRLWDTGEGELLQTMDASDTSPVAMAFTPDGKRVVQVASTSIWLWEVATGELIRKMVFDTPGSASLAISMQGRLVLVCDGSRLSVVDPEAGKVVRAMDIHADPARAAAFAHDGKSVLFWTEAGVLRVSGVDPVSGARDISAPYATTVLTATFGADGKQIVAGENGKRVLIWDLGAAELRRELTGPDSYLRSVTLSPDGSRALAGDGVVFTLWDATAARPVAQFDPGDKQLLSAAMSPDGRIVLAGGPKEGVATIHDAANGAPLRALQGEVKTANRALFSPDSRLIVTIGYQEPIRLWDAATGNLVRTLKGSDSGASAAAFAPDGRHLVATGDLGEAYLWDVETGERVGPKLPTNDSYVLSPDNRHLLGTGVELSALIELANARTIVGVPGQIPFETPVAFAPGGQSVLIGGHQRVVTERDLSTGSILRVFSGHTGAVVALALSPDGRRMVTAGPDTMMKVWSLDTGALLATFVAAESGEWIIVTPEGFYNASPKGGDLLRVVRGFDTAPVARVREQLQRPDLVTEKIAGDPRGVVREAAAKLDLAKAFAP